MNLPDSNPKTVFGKSKPGISAIPPVALLHLGRAMDDGEAKYGLTNWRENEVSASVYYNAAFRHLAAWWDGEQFAPDSQVHHLGHVMACCAILIDAEHMAKLNDDRPSVPGPFSRAVAEMTRAIPAVETATAGPVAEISESFDVEISADIEELALRVVSTSEFDEIKEILASYLRGDWGAEGENTELRADYDDDGTDEDFGIALGEPRHLDEEDNGEDEAEYEAVGCGLMVGFDLGLPAFGTTHIEVRSNVSAEQMKARAQSFLAVDAASKRLAMFGNMLRHLKADRVVDCDPVQRTRLDFYISCAEAGINLLPSELDSYLISLGVDWDSL